MEKHKVLIVDDEPNILNSLRRVLDADDREIYLAEDAEKAFDVLKKEGEMEVVICDNRLPGMMGIDFLSKIKPNHPDTIRILITGYPDLSTAMDAINKAHIWRYILKPLEVEELQLALKQAFDYYKILRENRLLLQIARQQAEWLKVLKERYPQVVSKEIDKKSMYVIDEKRVSEIIAEFLKRYYPLGEKE